MGCVTCTIVYVVKASYAIGTGRFVGADVATTSDRLGTRYDATLVDSQGAAAAVLAGPSVDGRANRFGRVAAAGGHGGKQLMGKGGAEVVLQRAESGINGAGCRAYLVGITGSSIEGTARIVAYQIVA